MFVHLLQGHNKVYGYLIEKLQENDSIQSILDCWDSYTGKLPCIVGYVCMQNDICHDSNSVLPQMSALIQSNDSFGYVMAHFTVRFVIKHP